MAEGAGSFFCDEDLLDIDKHEAHQGQRCFILEYNLAKDATTKAIDRLDSICDVLHRLSQAAEKGDWPNDLRVAAAKLASDIEILAGAMDQASEGVPTLKGVIERARDELPEEFAAFARAIVSDLSKSLP